MTAVPFLLALCLASPWAAHASRLTNTAIGERKVQENDHIGSDLTGEQVLQEAKHCCCKEDQCRPGARGEDEEEAPAVYSPQYNLCCKKKKWSCSSVFTWSYRTAAPSEDFCKEPQDTGFQVPAVREQVIDVQQLKPGSAGHTVHNYCATHHRPADPDEDAEQVSDTVVSTDQGAQQHKRNALIGELVKELSRNSLDSMAKEIFSLYICVRWAPNPEFARLAKDEIDTEQLPKDAKPLELYAQRRFIPMRCSRNVPVYNEEGSDSETHYRDFELTVEAISGWLRTEADGAVQRRMQNLQDATGSDLKDAAKAFDVQALERKVAKCGKDVEKVTVDVAKAPTSEIFRNCGAAKWWLEKLRDWQYAMPFTSFMSPDEEAAKHAPHKDQQVLVCFGKRVASQLHRRSGGEHLLADQSAVGCHGFWDLKESANMLHRTVQLWRPPTCQLAALELDMKMKIMDLIAQMNTQLFDAMPAILLDEMDGPVADEDGKQLHAAGKLGIAGGMLSAVFRFFTMKRAYTRLGQLLGNTVVKWAVCPLRPLADYEEESRLDNVLGSEDDLARYYAEQAYAKWSGKQNLLPGQECSAEPDTPVKQRVPRCEACSLGIMRENMPEPYHGEEFICPVRPLLPAKAQLKVLAEKTDLCVMHMTAPQWMEREWIYRGRSPHKKQYNKTENLPEASYEVIKILSWRSVPDADFGIQRDFVTYGRGCTEEEFAATPRWCTPPKVANPAEDWGALKSVGKGVGSAAGGAVNAIGKALEVGGLKQETAPMNNALKNRMLGIVYGAYKATELNVRTAYNSIASNAPGRHDKLHKRLFAEVEAGELLHSASFQRELANTGSDSKNNQKYDRYSVVCPCKGFDPQREFRLKYTAGERALRLAYKAHKDYSDNGALFKAQAFVVQLQATTSLFMSDNENAWTQSDVFMRAGPLGGNVPAWRRTADPFLLHMSGVSHQAGSARKEEKIFGFRATFTCGTRKAMHDLRVDFTVPDPQLMPFGECVRKGAEDNKAMREASPTTTFFPEETVVRVTFAAEIDCFHESFTKDDNKPQFQPSTDPKEPPKRNFFERENPLHRDFSANGKDCKPLAGIKNNLPPKLVERVHKDHAYRGLLVAKGLPKDSLLEVLVDPKDVLAEVKF